MEAVNIECIYGNGSNKVFSRDNLFIFVFELQRANLCIVECAIVVGKTWIIAPTRENYPCQVYCIRHIGYNTIILIVSPVQMSTEDTMVYSSVRRLHKNFIVYKQEASRPDSSAIYNWLSNHIKFTQSEIMSSRSRFEHYSKSLI